VNAAEIMRRLARAAETGDADAYWSLHTDDFVAHIPGQSRIGGDHRGRSALEALDDLENELTEGSIEHEVHDTLLSEEHAVLLMRLLASRPGRGSGNWGSTRSQGHHWCQGPQLHRLVSCWKSYRGRQFKRDLPAQNSIVS
jgi:hypothetical protein